MIRAIKNFLKQRFPFLLSVQRAVTSVARHRASRKTVDRIVKGGAPVWVEVGSGDKKGRGGWVTVDIAEHCDLYWDLRRGLPFPDGSIGKIYSSHFLEHLTFEEGRRFLDECRRALVPGGTFSICVPNARLYIEAYVKGETLDTSRFFGYKPAYNHTTRIDYVNFTAYMGGHHKYMFDEENLLHVLAARGFRNARLRRFDPDLDRKERDFESIYAEAEN